MKKCKYMVSTSFNPMGKLLDDIVFEYFIEMIDTYKLEDYLYEFK